MKKSKYIFFGIILFFIIATGAGFYIKAISNYEVKKDFVYAKMDIPAKTIITLDMLEYKSKPISDGHKLSISNANDIIGKITRVDISDDEMILTSRLADPNMRTGEIELKNKTNRKYTVEFKPDQAVAWMLETDQTVDIIFVPNSDTIPTVQTEPQNQQKSIQFDKKSIIRLEKIRIAGIIDEAGQLIIGKTQAIPRYICFEVTTEQDQFLAWAKGNGRLEVSAIPLDSELKVN